MVQGRKSGGLPSAARRRALRFGFIPRSIPASAPLPPLTDTQTEAQAITNRSCMADSRSRPESADISPSHTNRTRNNVRAWA